MSNDDDDCVLEEDIDDAYDLANEDEDALLAGDEGTQSNDWRNENFEDGRQDDVLVISPNEALLDEPEEDLRVGLRNKANQHGWDTEEAVATHVFEDEKAEESEEEEEEEDTEGRARFRQERVIQAPPRTQRQSIPDTLENVQVPVERNQFSGRGMGNHRQGRWPRGARGHRGGRMNPGMQRMPQMQQHQQAYQQQQNSPQLMQQKPQQRQQQQQMQRQAQSPQQQMRVAPFQHQELNRPQVDPQVGPLKNTSQKILVNPHFKGRRPDGPDLSWLPQQMSSDYSTPQTQQHANYQPPVVQQQQPRPAAPPTAYQGDPYYNQSPGYYHQQPPPSVPAHVVETWSGDTQYNQYQGPPTPHQLPPQHLGPPPNMNYPMRTHVPPPQQQPPMPVISETWTAAPTHPQEYYHQPPEYQQHQPPVLPPMVTQPQRQPTPPGFGNRPHQYEAQQPRFNFPQQQPQYQPPPPIFHSEPDYSVPPPNFQAPVNNYPPTEPIHPPENTDTWDNSSYTPDYYQPPRTDIQPLMHPPFPTAPHIRPTAPPRGLPASRRQGSPMRGGPVRRGMPPAGRGVGPLTRPSLMGQPRQISPMQGRTNMQKATPVAAIPAQVQGRQNMQHNTGVVKQLTQQRPPHKLGMTGVMKRPAAVAAKYPSSPPKQPRMEVPKGAVTSAESDVPQEEEDEEMQEYRKRIEEQKRMREAILRRKEIARRQAALKKQQEMGISEEGVEPEPVSTIATLVNRNPVHTSPTQKAEVVGIQSSTTGIKTVQTTMTQNKPQVLATRGRGRGGMMQPLVTKRKVVAQNVGTFAVQGATPTGVPGVTRLANTQNIGLTTNKQPPQVTKQGLNVQRGRGTPVRGAVSRGRIAAGAATRGLVNQKIVRTVQQPANSSTQATRGITRGAGVVARGTGRKVILGANTAQSLNLAQRDPEDKIIPDHKMRVVLVENLAASVTKEKLMKLKGDLSLMELLYFPSKRSAKFYFATSVDAQQFCKKNNKRMIDLSLITAKMDDPGPTQPPDLSFLTNI